MNLIIRIAAGLLCLCFLYVAYLSMFGPKPHSNLHFIAAIGSVYFIGYYVAKGRLDNGLDQRFGVWGWILYAVLLAVVLTFKSLFPH